jgi:hypothetical protein
MKELLKVLEDKRAVLIAEANELTKKENFKESNLKLERALGISDAIDVLLYSKHGAKFVL